MFPWEAPVADRPAFASSPPSLTIALPEWAPGELNRLPARIPALPDRMAAVIRFARLNVQQRTGGPFAAGVFERDSGRLVVIGVNRVVPDRCSSAHAEIVALSLAQQILGTYDLGGPGLPALQLVINWRTCAMCYGAVVWSGVRSVAIAGSGPEMEQITGFDEGPIHPEWRREWKVRGIQLVEDVLRDEALEGFREFAATNPVVYNGRKG
jgi:tRNA(Arg) A34 adenosine deaminase TadA